MNLFHRRLCRSEKWRRKLEDRILPFALAGVDLGEDVLEIGPGPGLTTELLSRIVPKLTAVEIDPRLVRSLKARLAGAGVTIVQGDALALPFPEARFSGAVALTMLHHVPSPGLQDRVLREVARVLKPGGLFAGVDSLASFSMRLIHIGDILVPLDPATFGGRLERAGFREIVVEANAERLRFRARR
ncbi:MAG: class I SAM-dependent methyltransferase [Candidatus Aminicenantes bacterium]|nr:class I SAM-dependent methyltransferase [Candidatus Aminicenantes bacterium]NLH77818.1 class I SAM-dependent methyltransferase [Acidobacteriota bacterium]